MAGAAPGWMVTANDTLSDFTGLNKRIGGPYAERNYNSAPVDYTGRVQQAQGFNPAEQAQARAGQQSLGQMLAAASAGNGPSAAQAMFAQQSQAAQNQARGMLNANRGAGGALNAYYASQNVAQGVQNAAAQAAMLKAQEMQQARAQYAGLLDQQRGGDLQYGQMQNQLAMGNATQFNQMLANAQAEANQLRAQQNQQIYNVEQARQAGLANARNQVFGKALDFAGGAFKGMGSGMFNAGGGGSPS